MSRLGDLIIERGPYYGGERMTAVMAGVVDVDQINELRDELIELRAVAAGPPVVAHEAQSATRETDEGGEVWTDELEVEGWREADEQYGHLSERSGTAPSGGDL